jgi:PST family polysaccharide transporter
MNNILGVQYLSAKRKDKYYLYAFICGAFLTVVLNFILIPLFLINGILCAMIVGEIALTLMMIILIKGKNL